MTPIRQHGDLGDRRKPVGRLHARLHDGLGNIFRQKGRPI
jgi:hypothetical protein